MSNPLNIIRHSKNIDDSNNFEYVYQLTLYLKDGSTKDFVKVENKNYTTLFNFKELIEYDKIDTFNLIITITRAFLNSENFIINGSVNSEKNIFKNNDIYLEFNKNKINYTKCICTLNSINTTRLFFTPPNY